MSDYALQEIGRTNGSENWMTLLILLALSAYAMARLFFPKYWHRYIQAMVFPIEVDKLLLEKNSNLLQFSFVLNVLGVMSISLFMYLTTNKYFPFEEIDSGIGVFGLYFVILGFLTGLKHLVVNLLGNVFKNEEMTNQFNHVWLVHLKFFGFLFLLWSLLIIYLPNQISGFPIYGGWITFITMLIMNNLRGFIVMRKHGVSLLYGILYLCSLEFLPVLMIVSLSNL